MQIHISAAIRGKTIFLAGTFSGLKNRAQGMPSHEEHRKNKFGFEQNAMWRPILHQTPIRRWTPLALRYGVSMGNLLGRHLDLDQSQNNPQPETNTGMGRQSDALDCIFAYGPLPKALLCPALNKILLPDSKTNLRIQIATGT